MRIPARPRLSDGTVFSSLAPALQRARMRLDIAADMARPGFAPRCILEHIAFSVSKL